SPAALSCVEVANDTLFEPESAPLEDRRVELAAVVDDDRNGRPQSQRLPHVQQDTDDPVRVGLDRSLARPGPRGAHLELTSVVEPEELVGIAVLLVIVD